MKYIKKRREINERSEEILGRCVLGNGAIVAADVTREGYPVEAKNYYYVWPRDAAMIMLALKKLGREEAGEGFLRWMREKNADYKLEGVVYEKYYPNGLPAPGHHRFQVDQTGTVLWALGEMYGEGMGKELREMVGRMADGICEKWRGRCFGVVCNDVWEERNAFPDLEENFTYSLGVVYAGLRVARRVWPRRKRYVEVSEEVWGRLEEQARVRGRFGRSYSPTLDDGRVDASLLGLVWPFGVIRERDGVMRRAMRRTIKRVRKELVEKGGVRRYVGDEYDGWMYETTERRKGAGSWPLLNIWLAEALRWMGRRREAERFRDEVVRRSEGGGIAEQVFDNRVQKSPTPLGWAQACWVMSEEGWGKGDG